MSKAFIPLPKINSLEYSVNCMLWLLYALDVTPHKMYKDFGQIDYCNRIKSV